MVGRTERKALSFHKADECWCVILNEVGSSSMPIINTCVFFLLRYLVDSRWFKQWKKYVGFDSWDKYQMGDQNVYPGPIDNSGLLKGNCLSL